MAKFRKFETISLDKEKRHISKDLTDKKVKLTPYKKSTKDKVNIPFDLEDDEDEMFYDLV